MIRFFNTALALSFLITILVVGIACSSTDNTSDDDLAPDTSQSKDLSDASPPDSSTTCAGVEESPPDFPFQCIEGCGSDAVQQPTCQDGEWVCSDGLKRADQCDPSESCPGNTAPVCVESCDDENPVQEECDSGSLVCPDGTFRESEEC